MKYSLAKKGFLVFLLAILLVAITELTSALVIKLNPLQSPYVSNLDDWRYTQL
jgi:hypothetical protein